MSDDFKGTGFTPQSWEGFLHNHWSVDNGNRQYVKAAMSAREPSSPTYTKAELLASPLTLSQLLMGTNYPEKLRNLMGIVEHREKFKPGGEWDEDTPEGRAALLDVLGVDP